MSNQIAQQSDPVQVKPYTHTRAKAEEFRKLALANGYSLVAVRTGQKKPLGLGWQHGHRRQQLIPAETKSLNTGILTKRLFGLDIDIDDPALAYVVRESAERIFSKTITRFRCNSPRILMLYRPADGPRKKEVRQGPWGKIEALGDGQQFVADGVHESAVAIEWEGGHGPHTTPEAELAQVTETKIAEFFAEIEKQLPATTGPQAAPASNVVPLLPGAKSKVFSAVGLPDMNAAASGGMDERKQEREWLDKLSEAGQREASQRCVVAMPNDGPEDWDRFSRVGMMIQATTRHLSDGESFGRELFLQWSRKNPCHNEDYTNQRWDEICRSPPTRLGIGSLIHEGKQAGARFDDLIYGVINPPSTAPATQPGAATTTVVNTYEPWSLLPPIMDASVAGPEFNKRLGFAHMLGGSPSYFQVLPDGTLSPVTQTELFMKLAPYQVRVGSANDAKLMPAGKYWTTWHKRRTVDRVICDPEGKLDRPGEVVENTWRGFAVQRRPGKWFRIALHIARVICGGNIEYFRYLIRWLAFAVQRPGTNPEIMVVLRSNLEGVGKSTLGLLMCRIFGPHGYSALSLRECLSDFNDALEGKAFLLFEENAFPGDHKMSNAIKGLITSPVISINPKGRRRYTIPNMLHTMMCTNEAWAIPAGPDARRFFVLDVTRKMDPAYFHRLYAEIDNGGVEAMLDALLRIDLAGFDPRRVPRTRALIEQQRRSADDITQWIMDGVMSGELVPYVAGGGFGQWVSNTVLHAAYGAWVKQQGGNRPKTAAGFGRELGRLGLVRGPSNRAVRWQIPDADALLRAAYRRAGIG